MGRTRKAARDSAFVVMMLPVMMPISMIEKIIISWTLRAARGNV